MLLSDIQYDLRGIIIEHGFNYKFYFKADTRISCKVCLADGASVREIVHSEDCLIPKLWDYIEKMR